MDNEKIDMDSFILLINEYSADKLLKKKEDSLLSDLIGWSIRKGKLKS